MRRTILFLLTATLVAVSAIPAASAQEQPPALVYISWDGTPGVLADRLLAEGRMPNLQRLVDSGAYIPRTQGNWPSITPPGHAALWTGAYSSVNGIGISIPDVLTPEEADGARPATRYGPVNAFGPNPFSAENLLVEPVWVTAARNGRTTTAVSVTHASPFEMYTTDDYVSSQGAHAFGDFGDELLLADPYRTSALPPKAETVTPAETDAGGWEHVPAWPDATFRAFRLGGTPDEADEEIVLHGLAIAPDGQTFTHVALDSDRDYETAQVLRDTPFANDASQLSGPLRYSDCAGEDNCVTGYAHLRLTDLADDGSAVTLWRTYLRELVDYTTDPSRIDEWIANGGAFTGNGATLPPIDELPALPSVYGEIAFQVNEYSFDNLVHEIQRDSADLYFSYSPYPDEWMHQLYGYTLTDGPAYTPRRAAVASGYINAMMSNLDDHLGEVIDELERSGRDWNIVLSTDHGFEPQYHSLYPARALRDAGLTVIDANGTLDASRTKAFYAGSGVIRVNRRGVYAGGIVGKIPGKRDYTDVIGQVRQALLRVRGVDGERVVKRVVRSKRFRREGVGGPHGGELHIVLYPNRGYYWASDLAPAGAPVIEANTSGGGWHGNRVVGNPSMQGFAVLGGDQFADGVVIRRARSIDLTPTAAAAVSITPAEHWRGRVLRAALDE